MRKNSRNGPHWRIASIALVISLSLSGGCATLAHQNRYDSTGERLIDPCDNKGDVCPWLAADFALLLAGVVPGVIALAVDGASGDWKHKDASSSHF